MSDLLVPGQLISNRAGGRTLYERVSVKGGMVVNAWREEPGPPPSHGPWIVIATLHTQTESAFYSFVLSSGALGWYWVYDYLGASLLPRDETPADVVLGG